MGEKEMRGGALLASADLREIAAPRKLQRLLCGPVRERARLLRKILRRAALDPHTRKAAEEA
jgi:hypothetical protein